MSTPLALPGPGVIAVGSLAQAKRRKRHYSAVITLEDPAARASDRLRFTTKPTLPHLVLSFEDVDQDLGYRHATLDQVSQALDFGRAHAKGSVLVHCFHGVGRSAGIALAILADRAGPGNEAAAVAQLFELRPEATPNVIVAHLADQALGRDGALFAALAAHEARDSASAAKRERRRAFALANPHLYSKP